MINSENISKALKSYDLKEYFPVILLRESSDNSVFLIGEKNRKVLRVSKRLPIKDIQFEFGVIDYLSKNNFPVPNINHTVDGNFYVLINDNVAVLFDFIDGHQIQIDKENLPTIKQSFNAGKSLGIFNNISNGFITASPRNRNIFSELERSITLADKFINDFEGGVDFIDHVKNMIEFAKKQTKYQTLIHNDYRPGNVFFGNNDEVVGVIDFDWSTIGPAIKDFALASVEWSFPDGGEFNEDLFNAFLDGYNSSSKEKIIKNQRLYSWIKFSTLSDASTYFCDLAEDKNSTKRIIKSYMYKKFLFFSKI